MAIRAVLLLCVATATSQHKGAPSPKGGGSSDIMVWTQLSQAEVEACLPRGASLTASGRNAYRISGLTLDMAFVANLMTGVNGKNLPVPRFGRVGSSDPRGPTAAQNAFAIQFGEVLINMVQAGIMLEPNFPVPPVVLLDPNELTGLLNGMGQGPKGPFVGPGARNGKGKWVKVCEPTDPCPRPEEPVPADVDDCKDEQAEVDRVLSRINDLEAYINSARLALVALESKDALSDAADLIILVFTVYAIYTTPIGLGVTIVIVLTEGGIAKLGKDAALDLLQEALTGFAGLDADQIRDAIAEAERRIGLYAAGLRDALAELRACRIAAVTTEAENEAAFNDFINNLLPAYYDCLAKRKCYYKWIATE